MVWSRNYSFTVNAAKLFLWKKKVKMNKLTKIIGLSFVSVALLAGCQTTTEGQGRVEGIKGTASQGVTFSITEEFLEDSAKATARLASGEVFTGKMIINKTETEKVTDTFDFDKDDDDDTLSFSDSTSYSSKAKGILFSAKRSMTCSLTLSSPSSGFSGGGIGKCELSTGEVLPFQF